jgi:hypothetical protein
MLRKWISRPDLGGGIAFSGKDLAPGKSVYEERGVKDMIILSHRGFENDAFTRFLAGPVFSFFEKYFYRRWKVGGIRSSIVANLVSPACFRILDHPTPIIWKTKATCITTQTRIFEESLMFWVR